MGRGDRRCNQGRSGLAFRCLMGDPAQNLARRRARLAARQKDVDESRVDDRRALERVPGDEAARFRRENPDADIYDWERRARDKGGGG